MTKFQSAPLTEARGDNSVLAPSTLSPRFQSAPLTEARGDVHHCFLSFPYRMFQSAPLTEARGDTSPSFKKAEQKCFNPLPLPKQGEMKTSKDDRVELWVSIRSPYRSKGRYCREAVASLQIQAVSIRSPYRSKGRLRLFGTTPCRVKVSIRSPYRSKGRYETACCVG